MKDNKINFKLWLEYNKGLSESEANHIVEIFSKVDEDVAKRAKGHGEIFDVGNEDEYDDICAKYLTKRQIGLTLGKTAVEFFKNKLVFAEFIRSEFFSKDDTELVAIIESYESTKATVTAIQTVKDEAENSEEKVDNSITEQEPEIIDNHTKTNAHIEKYINTFIGTCSSIVQNITGDAELEPHTEVRGKASLYFDICNETVCVATENSDFCLYPMPAFAVNSDKMHCLNASAQRYYFQDGYNIVSPYMAVNKIFPEMTSSNSVNNSIGKGIASIASHYKTDGNGIICLMPDSLDAFNRDIRNQLSYGGKRIFSLPKSVARMVAEQNSGRLELNKNYYVIDLDGKEPSVVELMYKSENGEPVIIRKGLKKLKTKHRGYGDYIGQYLQAYYKKHNVEIAVEIENALCNCKAVADMLIQKSSMIVPIEDEYFELCYDKQIANQLMRNAASDVKSICDELELPIARCLVLCAWAEDCTQLFNGCRIIEERLMKKLPLWKEYLPKLSLEVVSDGSFTDVELIPENEYRDVLKVLDSEEVIKINGTVTLAAGMTDYTLPLDREVIGSLNAEKQAYLSDPSFPLDRDVVVRMEIRYSYGDEDSYKLYFYAEGEAPFKVIKNEWRDIQNVRCITPPSFKNTSINLSDIDNIINGCDTVTDRLRKISSGTTSRIDINAYESPNMFNVKQSSLFKPVNWCYIPFRRFFTTNVYNSDSRVREYIDNNFCGELLFILADIAEGIGVWDNIKKCIPFRTLDKDAVKVLHDNAIEIAGRLGVVYNIAPSSTNVAAQINRLTEFFITLNKLRFLAPISRCVQDDKYGIFNALNKRIKEKKDKGGTSFAESDLRSLGSNCWHDEMWIYNLYYAEHGKEVTKFLVEKTVEYIENFKINQIGYGYNPRKVRDIMELLLCLTRADIFARKDGDVLFDPSSERIRALVKKIKQIDATIYNHKYELDKEFKTRLDIDASLNKGALKNVNDLSYMLISTLTGGEEIKLIGFTEE